ncbi:hypothetical protein B0T16DRAFT_420021 [Cercophora newfieldiana]|uniref:Diaminohydroxyphosphoribosylamino-pyrimidine deaminase n=1 Tax=Cercophora newfieldiana TaxID=92897 RepID=A0AA40CJT7_9PEZI|nr:hypothetical protein B0T16DRAFT_420021 [Cercophora newfieldiana]
MKIRGLLQILADPIEAPDEETYDVFAQSLPSHSLGFIDPKASALELTIAGRDLTIHQSPGVLSSNRSGGTTGAVVWKITPLFAEWISSDQNPLFTHGLLNSSSHIIELGCGISALVGILLAPRVTSIVLTDQSYVAKLVEQNIAENDHNGGRPPPSSAAKKSRPAASSKTKAHALGAAEQKHPGRVHFTPLDWETDTPTAALTLSDSARSFDAVVACDCIYNEALIDPFVSACADVCRLRGEDDSPDLEPTVCVIAQQLRDPEIFEAWLTRFMESFHAYRVPDEMLLEGLRSSSGFVVHIGILKGAVPNPESD